ncbi:MAG: hypothetical protein OXC40_00750 [Proteobacteria bacterium]|nr:hypothetical protein [Pseudomonadota bacterium]
MILKRLLHRLLSQLTLASAPYLTQATLLFFIGHLLFNHTYAADKGYPSSDLEVSGGLSGGMIGGGVTAFSGVEAIRINPAMLSQSTDYQVSGSFHWPTYGRNFYQGAIVDGTGPVKAGLLYTAPLNRTFDDSWLKADNNTQNTTHLSQTNRESLVWGMKTIQKFNLSLAQSFQKISFGITGAYLEGMMRKYRSFHLEQVSGVTFGIASFFPINQQLLLGVSCENLNNQQIVQLAPTIFRAGFGWLLSSSHLAIHGDYLRRQRVRSEWILVKKKETPEDPNWSSMFDERDIISDYEQSVVASIKGQFQEIIVVTGAYRMEIGNHGLERQGLAAGISVAPELYSISYTIQRPDLSSPALHQSVSLAITLKM